MSRSSSSLLSGDDHGLGTTMVGSATHFATTTLKVDGMTCGACTAAVEGAFKDAQGVGNVSVSLVLGRAVVHHDPTILSVETVARMIEDRGFGAQVLATEMQPQLIRGVRAEEASSIESRGDAVSTTTLAVVGMTCGACTSAVEGGLVNTPGIRSITVSLLSERVVVEHDLSVIAPDQIAEIIEHRGFDATVLDTKTPKTDLQSSQRQATTTVSIEGMTCGACTSSVENALKGEPGLMQFNISLLAERAVVVHDPSVLSAAKITELIGNAGFDARILSSQTDMSILAHGSVSVAFNVYGMPDANAASALEDILRQTSGVISADVSISNSSASVTYSPSRTGIRNLVSAIEGIGFNALLAQSDDNNAQIESLAKTKEIHEWRRAFWFSLSFAIPVMLIGMLLPMYLPALDVGRFEFLPGLFLGDILCLILTVPVQFGIGLRFYISAFKSLKHRSPTMDVLVILGTSAAFFFSILAMAVSIFCKPHSRPSTIFETSTMLITFITLGRWLENRAKGQTSSALSRLMSLAPSMALIYDDPIAAEKKAEELGVTRSPSVEKKTTPLGVKALGQKTIPTELIQVGDIVCLRPGDKVPADGAVIRGESYIDESMITGEAIPIRKIKGQLVIAGTVNGTGWVDFRVTKAGRDTQLSQIVKLVQDAQTSRAPIQRMADVVAGYFVPAIISLGLVTFLGWMILSHILPHPPAIFLKDGNGGKFMVCLKLCISVIVFACPCALGLSTPTAVMVGTGVGAEHGILVKGGAALEAATKINHVVFDKTGTLTMGRMSVAETKLEPTWSSNEWRRQLWWLIVGLTEMTSEHPVGKAILASAKTEVGISSEDPLDGVVVEFEAVIGKGVSALVEPSSNAERVRYPVLIGNAVFLHSRGVQVPDSVDPDFQASEVPSSLLSPVSKLDPAAGITLIHIAIDRKYAGTISLQDTVKPTAKAAVAALHRMGLTTSLITGDAYSTALAIATAVGIPATSIHASASPSNKQTIIASLQSAGKNRIAMVGDGINDSPALATASVGIALASGTDVALEAADIVLMQSEDLLSVPASLCLSRTIFNRIRLNLIWACLYNAIGLPFAMGLFLPFSGISLHPMAAGAAMAASSVSVVASSLLLKFWKRPGWLCIERLELEVEQGKIDATGLSRGRGLWWRKSPYTSDRRSRAQLSLTMIKRLGSGFMGLITGKIKIRDEEGYVPLQTVEPAA